MTMTVKYYLAHALLTLYVYMYIQKSKIPGDIIYRKKSPSRYTPGYGGIKLLS